MDNLLDPTANPYAPGAGIRPPLLAGRQVEEDDLSRLVGRIRLGYVEPPRLLEGVRGVGKTVLLLSMRDQVRATGGLAAHVQARRDAGTLTALIDSLEAEVARASLTAGVAARVREAISIVRVSAFGVSISGARPSGSADPSASDPVGALVKTFRSLTEASVPVVVTIDELQEMDRGELSVLLVALQRSAGEGLPVGVIAAGLPGTQATAAAVESFAERMFSTSTLGPLEPHAAARAITEPATDIGVQWSAEATGILVEQSAGYPYFLQHFAAATWNTARVSPITGDDANRGVADSERSLDRSLVESRLGRLSARERAYVEAMADLGAGPHSSGEVAQQMGVTSDKVGSARRRLMDAGIIFSPAYGRVAFTVPLFDRLLIRRRG